MAQQFQLTKSLVFQLAVPLFILFLSFLICSKMLLMPSWIGFDNPNQWDLWNWSQRYPYLLEGFTNNFIRGTFYPRWIPTLMGGNGYPTFLFYPPAVFFFAVFFVLSFSGTVFAAKMSILAILF